jgi:hypothetical protein
MSAAPSMNEVKATCGDISSPLCLYNIVTHSSTRIGYAFREYEIIFFSCLAIHSWSVPYHFFCFENGMFLNGTCCLASCVNSVSNDRVPGIA